MCISSPKAIRLLPGEHREILGRLEVGWEKSGVLEHKSAISLKCVKIDEKLLWRAYRKSQTLFRTVPSRPLTASPSPRIRLWVHNPTPKLQSLLSRERLKLRDCPIFEYPVLSQERVKLRTSNLAGIFPGSIRTKAP